jgi:hypothetical protein
MYQACVNARNSAMTTYVANWRKVEEVATLTFSLSSMLTASWMSIQWLRHRKIRAHYTPQQYHRLVRNSGRVGLFITTSLIMAANAEALADTCSRKLAESATFGSNSEPK